MKTDKILILIIVSIFFLSFATYWQFKNFQKALEKVEIPKFEMPKIEFFPVKSNKVQREFISPDGKLKLRYSSDWIEMPKEALEKFNQAIIKEEAEVLLLAQKIEIEKGASASLVVQEFFPKEGLEEVIEEIKKDFKARGAEIEILKSEIKNGEAFLEGKSVQKEIPAFYFRERVILYQNKGYLIVFLTLEKDWPEFANEANEILNSVLLTL